MLSFKKVKNLKDNNIKYKIFQKMLLQNVTLKIMQKKYFQKRYFFLSMSVKWTTPYMDTLKYK